MPTGAVRSPGFLPRRSLVAAACAVLGLALGVVECVPGPAAPVVQSPPFDAARAWADLGRLVAIGPRQSGTPGAEAARVLMTQELSAAGLKPQRESFQATTPAGPLDFANLYADLEPAGAAKDAPWILLCTHFDTKRLPGGFAGANDGGSGTAVLLELARAIAKRGTRDVGYRFLFLDGEEAVNKEWVDPDNRYGSRHHAKRLVDGGQAARFKACILLDMIGDKDLLIEQEGYSDPTLYAPIAEAARSLQLDKQVSAHRGPEIIDDHLIFASVAKIPAVDLIDFTYGGPKNPFWHTLDDKLENCSQASLDTVGRVVLRALPALEKQLAP